MISEQQYSHHSQPITFNHKFYLAVVLELLIGSHDLLFLVDELWMFTFPSLRALKDILSTLACVILKKGLSQLLNGLFWFHI